MLIIWTIVITIYSVWVVSLSLFPRFLLFFFLRIRRPPRSTLDRSSAASDVYKRQELLYQQDGATWFRSTAFGDEKDRVTQRENGQYTYFASDIAYHPVSYTHLRAHETVLDLVCRLLLEKKQK